MAEFLLHAAPEPLIAECRGAVVSRVRGTTGGYYARFPPRGTAHHGAYERPAARARSGRSADPHRRRGPLPFRELVGPPPGSADVVLDFVGAQSTVDIARAVVTAGGDVAIVGLAGGALPVGFGTIAMEARVSVPFWGTRAELAEVIALARAGRIRAHVERFALTDVERAYARLRAGELEGRAVVVP